MEVFSLCPSVSAASRTGTAGVDSRSLTIGWNLGIHGCHRPGRDPAPAGSPPPPAAGSCRESLDFPGDRGQAAGRSLRHRTTPTSPRTHPPEGMGGPNDPMDEAVINEPGEDSLS